jgi:hypothetical protein
MQHYVFKNVTCTPLEVQIVFQSKYYTVARAITKVQNGNGEEREVYAEGIARRSYKDMNDEILGKEIASGRAKKALSKKLNGLHPRHILMNG